jgi:hypothetical protein
MRCWQWREALVVLRNGRGIVAAAALVAFNLLMFVLAAMGASAMEAPFLVAWMTSSAEPATTPTRDVVRSSTSEQLGQQHESPTHVGVRRRRR